jgi:hypothetical protein
MEYNLYILAKREIIDSLNLLIDRYLKKGIDLNDIKKWVTKKNNFKNILYDIRKSGSQFFDSETEYEEFVKDLIFEVLNDKIAVQKDNLNDMNENKTNLRCPRCGYFVTETDDKRMLMCPSCSTPIHQIITEVKDFGQFLNKLKPITETNVPLLKLDDIIDGISYPRSSHKYVLTATYKVPQDYIDLNSRRLHHYKVNDLSGDVMGNARVTFDAYVFDLNEIKNLNQNIIDYCVDDFMNQLPEMLNVFGVQISPVSFIDMKELEKTFEMTVTFDETVRIIGELLQMPLDMKIDNFWIWSNKKQIKK